MIVEGNSFFLLKINLIIHLERCSCLLYTSIILSILFLALYLYQKKNSTNDFLRDFTNAASVSLILLFIIFVGYHCFPSEDSLFSKLVSGEVIVGVTVAFPTFYTWYRRDKKEKADSEAHQEEQKKIRCV